MIEVQPDGTEIGAWEAGQSAGSPFGMVMHDWTAGDRTTPADIYYYGGGGACTNFYTGSGFTSSRLAPTAVGACGAGRNDHCVGTGRRRHTARALRHHHVRRGGHVRVPGLPERRPPLHGRRDRTCRSARTSGWTFRTTRSTGSRSRTAARRSSTRCTATAPSSATRSATARARRAADFNFGIMVEPDVQFASFGVSPTPLQTFARDDGWTPLKVRGATRYILGDPWTPLDWQSAPPRRRDVLRPRNLLRAVQPREDRAARRRRRPAACRRAS